MSDTLSHIGKYEIRREIGRGGSASVYEAFDPDVGRRVAIKVLHNLDGDMLTRFRQEATAAGNLRHKNIVTIYEFGEHEGVPFIAMEYLEGEDLQNLIKADQPIGLFEKTRIMREVAEGLQYAHQNHVVHRDVKPGNIKVQPDGQVKIMDFGIARLLREGNTRLTQTGYILGTLAYMPPEQFAGTDPGPLGDIFSYGVVYYELLTGRSPFAASDPASLIRNITQADPEPLSAVVPDCPSGLQAIVDRTLKKDPASRYQSMEDLLFDSEPFLLEVRKQRASELLKTAQSSILTGNLEAAQSVVRQTLELDPYMREARELREVIHRQLGEQGIRAPQRVEPPESVPAPLPPAPVRDFAESDGFTRLFKTVPVSPAPAPANPEYRRPEPPEAEATGVFRLPSAAPSQQQPLTEDNQAPTDTILTVSDCANSALVGSKIRLDRFPFTIGRGGTDWNLEFDGAISARHLEIDYRQGGLFIRDLESGNGTFVNGQRLHPMRYEVLLFGAHIVLGSNTELLFGSGLVQEIPDLRGQLVGRRFTLMEKLHSSSKSVLYLARDENLPREVAVKMLSPSLIRHSGYREQFSREAQTASLLRHDHICQMIDYGEFRLDDPIQIRSLYICTEYLPGGSLQARLNAAKAFPLEQIAAWLEMISEALAFIHRRGVIHAGIRPSAIVFDAEGNPYITDFAFASRSGEGSGHTVVGAPAYLAPEQWDGTDPLPATDQYSLGVLFYLLVSGVLPFEGQEHFSVRSRNLMRGPMPAHEMAAQNGRGPVPPRVSAVLEKGLALKPQDRFANIVDFAAAFRAALKEPARKRSGPASVFISYQRAVSSLLAYTLKKEMEREHEFQVFVDAIQQDSTGQFPLNLQRRIQHCDVFVCLLAESTLSSDWVKREIQLAYENGKPMIPVFQESYRNPPNLFALDKCVQELLTFEGIKLLDQQNLWVDAAIQALIASTRRSLEAPPPPPRQLGSDPSQQLAISDRGSLAPLITHDTEGPFRRFTRQLWAFAPHLGDPKRARAGARK